MHPKIKLSRLRDIGWSHWDPIGLLERGESWEGKPFADEYDTYLMQVAGRLRRGEPLDSIVEYVVQIETEHMGLGSNASVRKRAAKLVEAIRNDDQVWSRTLDDSF